MAALTSNAVLQRYRNTRDDDESSSSSSEVANGVAFSDFQDLTPQQEGGHVKVQQPHCRAETKPSRKNENAFSSSSSFSEDHEESNTKVPIPGTLPLEEAKKQEQFGAATAAAPMKTSLDSSSSSGTHVEDDRNPVESINQGDAEETRNDGKDDGKAGCSSPDGNGTQREGSRDDSSVKHSSPVSPKVVLQLDEDVNSDNGGSAEQMHPISFWEAVNLLRADEELWKPFAPKVEKKERKPRGGRLLRFFSCSSGTTAADSALSVMSRKESQVEEDTSFLLALTKVPFDHDNVVLQRVLCTIYYSMVTPESVPSWRTRKQHRMSNGKDVLFVKNMAGEGPKMPGSAIVWDKVGFQGENPATDLRSAGIVGLLQLLFLQDHYPTLNSLLWNLCSGRYNVNRGDHLLGEELPYVLVGFNLTSASVDALQRGMLHSEASAMCGGTNVVDAMEERVNRKLGSDENAYCPPCEQERRSTSRFPVVAITCEYFVGCVHAFIQAWLDMSKKKYPEKPTVADFSNVKSLLFYKWNHKGKQREVLHGAAESRFLSLPPSASRRLQEGG